MKNNLTEKIYDLKVKGMINTEQINILLEMMENYFDESPKISPIINLLIEKSQFNSQIFEQIELALMK